MQESPNSSLYDLESSGLRNMTMNTDIQEEQQVRRQYYDKVFLRLRDSFELGQKEYAITGRALEILTQLLLQPITVQELKQTQYSSAEEEQLQDEQPLTPTQRQELYKKVLEIFMRKCSVFARMKPEQKAQIVRYLQQAGQKVAMIGDGANDCSAIKQADAGISFGNSDAGFSAPFSLLHSQSVVVVEIVLKNGQAAMQNIVDIIRLNILLNLNQYIGHCFQKLQASSSESYAGLISTVLQPLTLQYYAIYWQHQDKLSNIPLNDNMLSAENLISVYGQTLISSGGIALVYYAGTQYSWFNEYDSAVLTGGRTEYHLAGAALTVIIMYQFAIHNFLVATIISGHPYKKSIWYNKPVCFLLFVYQSYAILNMFLPQTWLPWYNYSEKVGQEWSLQLKIFLTSSIVGILMIFFQKIIVYRFFGYGRKRKLT